MNPVNSKTLSRRGLIKGLASIAGLTAISTHAMSVVLTPRATEGPFYPSPSMRLSDIDNDLVKVLGTVQQAGGEVIRLKGKLTSRNGTPLVGHRVEIWQCDVNGKYMHPGDPRDAEHDSGFQGFGHDITGKDGSYSFRTIKPAVYPGRTPHIHVKVLKGDRELLTTQFYIADDPNNRRDGLYRRMSSAEAASVSMQFTTGNGELETRVDMVV